MKMANFARMCMLIRALVRLSTGRVPILLLRNRPALLPLLPSPLPPYLQYVAQFTGMLAQFTGMYWNSVLNEIKIRWV